MKDKIIRAITHLKPKRVVANLGWRRPYIAAGEKRQDVSREFEWTRTGYSIAPLCLNRKKKGEQKTW